MNNEETWLENSTLDLFLVKLAGKYSKYSPGDIIFSEGNIGTTMLLILRGDVKITKLSSETNQPVTIATRSAGEFIGEMALVEESPRFASVISKTACEVLEITKSNFEKIIKEKPSFAINVLESLSNKLRESDSSRVMDLEKNNLELTETNQRLNELNCFLDSVIDQSPSAILLVTKSGDIFNMNKSAIRIFGLNKDKKYKIDDLFSHFNFSDCQQELQNTWSGKVNGLRVGEEFPAFLTCTILTTYRDELLYLVMGQDLTEISGFTSIKAIEDRYLNTKQSTYELAKQFFVEIDILKSNIDNLSKDISDNDTKGIESSNREVNCTIMDLKNDSRHLVDTYKTESNFTFIDIRVLMKTILKHWQSMKEVENIEFSLDVHKDFPSRVHMNEVSLQNMIFSLLNSASDALLNLEKDIQYSIKIDLCRSPDSRFSEIRIIPHLAILEPENVRKALNQYSIFGWDYIEQIIHHHEGEFVIENNKDNYPVIIIRLP